MDGIAGHPELPTLWADYNKVRLSGDKKIANKKLAVFISLLKQENNDIITSFSDSICKEVLRQPAILATNGGAISEQPLRIQHPLFRDIIVAVLSDQYKQDSAVHIRWIGQFEQYFYSDNSTTQTFLSEIEVQFPFDTVFFFERSYALSADPFTLDLLLQRIGRGIGYATHEVPAGVLFDPNAFDRVVQKFRSYWEKSDNKESWRVRLNEWTLLGQHWRTYHETKNDFDSFEHYLSQTEVSESN